MKVFLPLSIIINSVYFEGIYFGHTTPIKTIMKIQDFFFLMFTIYAKYYPVLK